MQGQTILRVPELFLAPSIILISRSLPPPPPSFPPFVTLFIHKERTTASDLHSLVATRSTPHRRRCPGILLAVLSFQHDPPDRTPTPANREGQLTCGSNAVYIASIIPFIAPRRQHEQHGATGTIRCLFLHTIPCSCLICYIATEQENIGLGRVWHESMSRRSR